MTHNDNNCFLQGHFTGERPWAHADEFVRPQVARIVGALKEEVAVMNGLTTNLHLMIIPFYRPTKTRFRIMMERKRCVKTNSHMYTSCKCRSFGGITQYSNRNCDVNAYSVGSFELKKMFFFSFPSDRYAVESQVRLAGLDPRDAIVEVGPRPGESLIHTEDILKAIDENKVRFLCEVNRV